MEGNVRVEYSRKFLKQAAKLPAHIISQAQNKETIFKGNPFDPHLNTHKLHGKEKELWAFSVTHSYRIKLIFLTKESVLFLEVGTHDIYQ